MEEIRDGLKKEVDISSFADPKYDAPTMYNIKYIRRK